MPLVKPINSGGCLFGHTNQSLLHLVVPLGICLQPISNNGQHNLELGVDSVILGLNQWWSSLISVVLSWFRWLGLA